ncbi:carbamoyltransferase [Candidatus Woesearchaeota archaeon]|jgi:carbamoyltransferase|nr:carbamoyltransferase [Candidatus Woesearchaeota archaeon]
MYVLGISCYYHDSSAALMKNGKIVAAAEEERFTRKKHDTSFPINAINYCLKSQKISINDVAHLGFYEKPFLKFERVLYQHLQGFPKSLKTFLSSMPSWINQKLRIMKKIRKDLKYKKDVLFIEHHLAHAASSFLVSPFKKAAILTVDGVGEWTTTTYGEGNENNIELLKELRFPHSVGLLYSTITAYMGFSVNNSEYKVMGLAPYGDMNRKTNQFYKKLLKVVDIKQDGSFRFDMSYFVFQHADKMPSKKLCNLLGGPIEQRDAQMTPRYMNLAAGVQLITEDILTNMLNHLHKVTKCDNLVMGGGVALNSVYNGKILRNTPFKKIWIQPNASDGGTSIGVATYIYNTIFGNSRTYTLTNAYLGPSFSTQDVEKYLKKNKIIYSKFKNDLELVKTTAKLISKNNVVGWFQYGMEWGPRALGSRSILANPCNPEAKELLNSKVKHREKFRPFAPVVCEDDALTYFDCDKPVPEPTDYMLMVYPVFKKWHKLIPSVTHVDGSGRLQTIRRKQNHLYYDTIKEFGKLSGVPILINTSFNIRGEPIVCTPHDAYKCMMGTGIDYLVIDKFIVKRNDNPEDMWDSEKYAKD